MEEKKLNLIRTMEFVCIDDFGMPVYRCQETDALYKDLYPCHKNDDYTPDLYTCGNNIDGDPGFPIDMTNVVFINKYVENPYQFTYRMLSRLKSDCEYYLGNGNRYAGCLWAKDEQSQILEIKEIYDSLPEDAKPEWLTMEQINEYERKMCE